MQLNFSNERVLALVAHPDDAELLCAGTLARARREGAAVGICVFCLGDRGQPAEAIPDLAAVRSREMRGAAGLLGADLLEAGCPDGTLADDAATRLRTIELVRRFRPTLMLAHSERDYHADHRAASRLAEAASWMAASRGAITSSSPLPRSPALWWMDTLGMHQFEPGLYVDISEYADLKEQMLACHKSQLVRGAADGFVPLLEELRTQMFARGRQAGVAAAEAFVAHQSLGRSRAW